jgi:hypothetical protein
MLRIDLWLVDLEEITPGDQPSQRLVGDAMQAGRAAEGITRYGIHRPPPQN